MELTSSLETRLDALAEYTRDLREIQPANFEAFERDKMLRRYAERMLHMAIEACIRIGIEVLTLSGFREAENYHDIFRVLGEKGVLPAPLVDSMTRLVELRNLLVYEHDVLDDTMLYGALKKRVDDLAEFNRAIRAFAASEPYSPATQDFAPTDELDDDASAN